MLCLAFLQVSSVSGILSHSTGDIAMSVFGDRNERFINPVLKELGYELLVLLKCFKIIPILGIICNIISCVQSTLKRQQ